MLIKITNRCSMACRHCMEDSRPNLNEHMTRENFEAALRLTREVEPEFYPLVLLSGGECTEHPQFEEFLEMTEAAGRVPVILTHGLWLADEAFRNRVLRPGRQLSVQVTNDPRFYPRDLPARPADDRIVYVDSLTAMTQLGRWRGKSSETVRERVAPGSFNIRSMTRHFGDFRRALDYLRVRASAGVGGHCTPSITWDGWVSVGESLFCWRVGTVRSTPAELTQRTLDMKACNRCGLETNLNPQQRRAIGLE